GGEGGGAGGGAAGAAGAPGSSAEPPIRLRFEPRFPGSVASLKGAPSPLPAASLQSKATQAINGSVPKALLSGPVADALAKVREDVELDEDDVADLIRARGDEYTADVGAADALRQEVCGDTVTYVVTRNINYTNVCYFRCGFCAFSKGKLAANLRGAPYLVPIDESVRRCDQAGGRGTTEDGR